MSFKSPMVYSLFPVMGKGILKRHESSETLSGTPDSSSKHVKWDEEKLKDSEAIKMTIPKGQIDEPKTPFQHGQYGSSCDESGDEVFVLKNETGDEEGGDSSEESDRINAPIQRRDSLTQSDTSGGWESSVSEFEDSEDHQEHEKRFKSMRAQHYFMKQALARGKELIETDEE